jgi:eukaryotic-like serine/threonine-protein kinase
MTLAAGTRLGPYEITADLGEGGMGEVYRATDTKLKREVALKLLPEAFSEDSERLARFEREAQLLAQLHHPHIASIFGLEESDGVRALVMELVEGPTLAERLESGAMPLEEALGVARQMVEALEAAHEKGIVHRDLKPANVKLRPDGTVKVLDFGLAKAWESESAGSGLSLSPTVTSHHTRAGVILGTAAYMSPEQARGKPVDKRTDIWAFGVVLWEMLTGRHLFDGETVSDVLANVLKSEVPLSALADETPAPVRELLRRCLERNLRNRLHDIADARIVLQELLESGLEDAALAPQATPQTSRFSRWPGWSVAFVLGAALAAALFLVKEPGRAATRSDIPRVTFRQLTYLAGAEASPALAPDGESFAFVKSVGGQKDIFLQRVGGTNAVNLTSSCPGNDEEPAFSPDGKRIAYHSECDGGGIFVMGATGESARKVTDLGHNPAWSPDGLELAVADEQVNSPFGRGTTSRLWAVRVETGERRLLSAHDAVQPSWSPDARRVAFWGLHADSSARDIYTVAADGSQSDPDEAVAVLDDPAVDWNPVWSDGGRALLFASTRGGTMNLWRISVDPASGRPSGEPRPVTAPSSWAGYLSASADGRRLAFVDRNVRSVLRVAAFDPATGTLADAVRTVPVGTLEVHETVTLGPDGGAVLLASTGMPQHLYLADPSCGLRQLTDGEHRDRQGSFSPDGQWIVFQSDRWPSSFGLIRADGSGLRELTTGRESTGFYPHFSPDGKRIAAADTEGAYLLTVAEPGEAGPVEALTPPGDGLSFWPMCFSPDGRRLAGTLISVAGLSTGAAVYTLADRSYRRVSSEPVGQVSFLPDGRRIFLALRARVEVVDFDSGSAHEVLKMPEGTELIWAELAGDGRHLTWHEQTDESDLWLATFEGAP